MKQVRTSRTQMEGAQFGKVDKRLLRRTYRKLISLTLLVAAQARRVNDISQTSRFRSTNWTASWTKGKRCPRHSLTSRASSNQIGHQAEILGKKNNSLLPTISHISFVILYRQAKIATKLTKHPVFQTDFEAANADNTSPPRHIQSQYIPAPLPRVQATETKVKRLNVAGSTIAVMKSGMRSPFSNKVCNSHLS